MSLESDNMEAAWADRLLMQLDLISDEEISWRASYSDDVVRDILDRARELLEVKIEPMAQLPDPPPAPNVLKSPTVPYAPSAEPNAPLATDPAMPGGLRCLQCPMSVMRH